ncbi:U2 small nuclear ribonucleoprotein B'' [Acrasis kona]|uniref:U2 small nuclear ribonucleoprotein B n=1 Tax=Acrasis kona TaxID=1008807 RepID=A0AAW2YZ75_9EUKA
MDLNTDVHHQDVAPNYTIYINNLNEKIKIPTLKEQLYALFSQFGPVLEVVAGRSIKIRGQAWIVFQDINQASLAKRKMQGADFLGKPMNINFAKSKSDAIAKLDKTLFQQQQERSNRRKREEEENEDEPASKRQNTGKKQRLRPSKQKMKINAPNTSSLNEPNKILFLESLPDNIHENPLLVEVLFQNVAGYKETRLIPGKGIGFVEYDNEINAAQAMTLLQNTKIMQCPMKITFAKK